MTKAVYWLPQLLATSDTFERAEGLLVAGADAIIIDTAHGHSAGVLRKVAQIRDQFPDATLIAGNVATGSGTRAFSKPVLTL